MCEGTTAAVTVVLAEAPVIAMPEHARVPIAFTVDRVFDVTGSDDRPDRLTLSERRLDVPYEKDYDALAGEGPLQWARRFDLSRWAFFTARLANRIVGAAAVAFDTPGLAMLEGRRDLAVRCSGMPRPGRGCACRFYERQGCRLEAVNRNAYPEWPEEIQPLWSKDLPR